MLIDDSLLYVLTFVFSTFFTVITFLPRDEDFESQISESGFSIGLLPAIMRISLFPLISAVGWGTLSIFSLTLNNCSQTFNACYTSPTYGAIGPAIANSFGTPLAIVFMLLSIMMVLMSSIIIFTISGIMLTATRNKRRGN